MSSSSITANGGAGAAQSSSMSPQLSASNAEMSKKTTTAAAAPASALVVEIEKDTVEDEDILLGGLELFPPLTFWTETKQASFAVNNRLLKSWLKQPSPCCAAASVAGSWNALCDLGRRDANAMTIQNVLDVYIRLVEAQIDRLSGSFRRKLGGSGDFDAFLADIERESLSILDEMQQASATEGTATKKTKAKKITKKTVVKATNKVLEKYFATYVDPTASSEGSEPSPSEASDQLVAPPYFVCLRDLIKSQESLGVTSEKGADAAAREDEESEEDSDEDEEEEDNNNNAGPSDARVDSAAKSGTKQESSSLRSMSANEASRSSVASSDKLDTISVEILDDELTKMTTNAERLLPIIAKKGMAEVIEIPMSNKSAKAGGFKGKKSTTSAASKASNSKAEAKPWNWAWDLRGIIHKRLGLYRLQNRECPSTTIIGNWGILEAAPILSEDYGLGSTGFTASLLMGKKLKGGRSVENPVSVSDDRATIAKQWSALFGAFQREDCILLYHLKNHYAPIYAMKEWTERDVVSSSNSARSSDDSTIGATRRQVLTARKGQRPTTWIDFDEVRSTLLSWDGYKIMLLSRGADTTSVDMRTSTLNNKREN